MAHREGIRAYLKDVEVHGIVYDWGAGTKPIKNYLKPNDAKFLTIDKREDVGSIVIADIEKAIDMSILDKADFAFCLEVIEHTWNPTALICNIYNHLNTNGVLYLSQPFLYPVHKEDDRIRFTHHGLWQLIGEVGFTVEDIHPTVGDLDNAEGYILKARK